MKINLSIYLLLSVFVLSCSKEAPRIPTYNKHGIQTKECSIRDAKGRGPYEPLGLMIEEKCFQRISKLCSQIKFKQIHRTKGHFARGKFGKRIKIGLCP